MRLTHPHDRNPRSAREQRSLTDERWSLPARMPNPFRWVGAVGYYYDEEAGTYYVRARIYSATIARWVSRDALFYPSPQNELSNLYAYVEGQLTSAVDPSGKYAIRIPPPFTPRPLGPKPQDSAVIEWFRDECVYSCKNPVCAKTDLPVAWNIWGVPMGLTGKTRRICSCGPPGLVCKGDVLNSPLCGGDKRLGGTVRVTLKPRCFPLNCPDEFVFSFPIWGARRKGSFWGDFGEGLGDVMEDVGDLIDRIPPWFGQ